MWTCASSMGTDVQSPHSQQDVETTLLQGLMALSQGASAVMPHKSSLCPAGNAAPAPSFSLAYEQGGVGKLLKEAQGGRLVPGQAPPKTGAASKNARRNAARKKKKEGSAAEDDGEEDQAQPSTVMSEPAAVNGHSTDAVASGGPGWQAETSWVL